MKPKYYRLTYKHMFLDMHIKPKTEVYHFASYGQKSECVKSLLEEYEHMQDDVAEDGTESYEFIEIVEVIKDEL